MASLGCLIGGPKVRGLVYAHITRFGGLNHPINVLIPDPFWASICPKRYHARAGYNIRGGLGPDPSTDRTPPDPRPDPRPLQILDLGPLK